MNRHLAALVLILLVYPAATLRAQESNDEWLADCRDGGRDWAYRFRHCEVRETGMKPNGRPLSVEPGMNGGVAIIGWDRDSIAVTAHIQVRARTQEDAEAIARAIKIEASGATVRVASPGGGGAVGRHQNWGVNLVVMVPRRTDLTISTENGPLFVEDVAGRMELETQNGPLLLSGVGGDLSESLVSKRAPIDLASTLYVLLGDTAAVTALLDRLLHHAHVLKCGPRSWRTT